MREIGQAELLRRAIEGRLLDVRTSIAAVVVSFDAATWTATVRPAVRVQAVDADSRPEVDTLPDVAGVPVQFPHWGPAVLYHPLSPGDVGRLEWSEEDDGEVYADADAEIPVNPMILRRHGAACAFRPEGKRGGGISGPEAAAGWLGRPGGVGIAFDANEVRLGGAGAADPVVRKSDLDAFVSTFNAHTHAVTGSSATGGAVVGSAAASTSPHVGTASAVVKSV